MNICTSHEGSNFTFPCKPQTLHFTREIWYLNRQSLTKVDGVLWRSKHRKGSLGGHEGRPGLSNLLKPDNSSCIFREASIVQCLANLHASVAIPTIHQVTPGL